MPPLNQTQKSCLALAIAHVFNADAGAANIDVNPGCTLLQAMQSAEKDTRYGSCTPGSGADTIVMPEGLITSFNEGYENEEDNAFTATPFVRSNITIQGNNSTIMRNTASAYEFRLFAVVDGDLTLNNLTIMNGQLPYFGGGIYVNGNASLRLNNTTVTNNKVIDNSIRTGNVGGGIFTNGGQLIIRSSEISGNSATGSGGGIFLSNDSSLNLINTEISGNSSNQDGGGINLTGLDVNLQVVGGEISGNSARRFGGGVNAFRNPVVFNNVRVESNLAGSRGGGLQVGGASGGSVSGNLTLLNSTLSGNQSPKGGGLFSFGGSIVITNSTVVENTATSLGGGIYLLSGRKAEVSGTTIASNTAQSGAGIYMQSAIFGLELENSTVSGNIAASNGGGIRINDGGELTLTHSTISANSANDGGGVFAEGYFFYIGPYTGTIVEPANIRGSNNIVSGNEAATSGAEIYAVDQANVLLASNNLLGEQSLDNQEAFFGFTPSQLATTATSDGDESTPLSSILSPLTDNGGRTATHALVAASPAINRGASSICNTVQRLDQRGFQRVGGCDLGAFEFNSPGIPVPPPPVPFKPATIVPPIMLLLNED